MVAPVIPSMGFSDFISGLVREHQGRAPLFGSIETTFRCNLNCIHCYVNVPAHDPDARAREVPLSRLLGLIDEIAEQGCLELLLTGGEVLIHSSFAETYQHAARKGLRVTVFTNGTLVTDEVVRIFKDTPPRGVEITLYGMTRETYECITRVKGSFERCLQGIHRLYRAGIPLKLKTMIMKWNVHELTAMREFSQNLGLPFRHDGLLNPRIDEHFFPVDKLQLGAEQLAAIDLEVSTFRKHLQDGAGKLSNGCPSVVTSGCNQAYTCGAGMVAFNIDPYGRLQLCQLARKYSFDLKNNSFRNGWDDFLPGIRYRQLSQPSACRHCTLASCCAGCSGASELECGDPGKPVARFCRITHARMYRLLGEIPGHRPDASCCLKTAGG